MFYMIKRILNIAGVHKSRIILGIVLNAGKTFFMSMMFLAVFVVLQDMNSISAATIRKALLILLISVAGRFAAQYLTDISMSAKGFDMFRDYRLAIGEKMKNAPMGYFSEQRLGTIQTILTSTIVELEQYSMLAITDITGGLSMALIIIIMMAFFSLPMALLSLCGLCAGLSVLQVVQKRSSRQTVKVQRAQEHLVTESLEYIRGIAVLRAFGQEKGNVGDVYSAFEMRRQAAFEQEHAAAGILKLHSLVYKLTSCFLLFLAVALYLNGAFTLPYCLMFLVTSFVVYSELELMGDGAFIAKKVNTELDRLEMIADIPSMDLTARKLEPAAFDIELKQVTFAYENRDVIKNVSLKVPQGSSCAIVGPSGSGKTTLCNLIARFWDVQKGEVLIGGKNVKDYTADSLLEHISMVFQNVYLFHDTIENNIRFGNPSATKEQVIDAARRACCHEFIEAFPDGYQTMIGEGGSTLSGGEKQRISIARAILKNAPIVILDEATSSVDPENEHELLNAIRELTKGKTLISIAHRLTTVRHADQIIVVDEGKIVQQGTHEELAGQPGIYQRFLKLRAEAIGWSL